MDTSTPPYDFGWNWGNPTRQLSDPATGSIGVIANSPQTAAAAAGIGVVLSSDKLAFVSVRPFIRYDWEYKLVAQGFGSSASARGGIDASAWVDGALHVPVRRHQAFADEGSWISSRENTGDGIAPVSEVELFSQMRPGKLYGVPFGAWVECEHSTGLGQAGSIDKVQGRVQFIVVERFVAG
jgi:hypothetical protein